MFHLAWKMINRFLAHGLSDHVIGVVGWWGRRYPVWLFLILLLFGMVSVVNDHVGRWADYLGLFVGLFVPFCLFAVSLAVFVWSVSTRAIEPGRSSGVLVWAEDEMVEPSRLELVDQPDPENVE